MLELGSSINRPICLECGLLAMTTDSFCGDRCRVRWYMKQDCCYCGKKRDTSPGWRFDVCPNCTTMYPKYKKYKTKMEIFNEHISKDISKMWASFYKTFDSDLGIIIEGNEARFIPPSDYECVSSMGVEDLKDALKRIKSFNIKKYKKEHRKNVKREKEMVKCYVKILDYKKWLKKEKKK